MSAFTPSEPVVPAVARQRVRPRFALFEYGFRPFFLLAGLFAAVVMPVWMAFLHGLEFRGAPLPPLAWHAHEMIYGFVAAAVAGFLLTAVPSWTGRRGFAGLPLFGLVVMWLAGRAVVGLPLGLAPGVVAGIDLTFLPLVGLTIAPSLIRSGNRRNLIFVVFLTLLFAANLRFHLDHAQAGTALRLALDTILLMVAVLGGRMIPAFTSSTLKQRGLDVRIPQHIVLDYASVGALVAVLITDFGFSDSAMAGTMAAIAALLLALRLVRWQGYRAWRDPLCWVLHVAYAWLPVGLALKALWLLGGWVGGAAWIHALTAGAFSTMILAVMSRASLGHTGRPLVASRTITVAFLSLTLAALSRVFGPVLAPSTWTVSIGAAALLWSTAFVLFLVEYTPILCRSRADGRPG